MPYEDFTITKARAADVTLGIVVKSAGSAIDISAWTALQVVGKLSLTARDSDAVYILGLGTGVTRAVGTAGIATAVIPGNITRALPNRERTIYTEVRGTDATGNVYSLARGTVKTTPITPSLTPFTPTRVLGLKGWTKSDAKLWQDTLLSNPAVVDDAVVGGWSGQGGATAAWLQGKSTRRPAKKLAVLNTLPVVHFDGADDFLQGPNLSRFISAGAFTLFAVIRATAGGAAANVEDWPPIFTDQAQGFVVGVGSAGKVGLANPVSGGTTVNRVEANYTLNTWGVVEARHESGTIGIRVNGGSETTTSSASTHGPSGGTTLAVPCSIGGALGGPAFLAGDIAEFLCWNVALSSDDKALVRTYLTSRWGVPSFTATVTPS